MSDDIYSGELHAWIEPEIEARVVALVLGEASAFEAEELERLMEERPEIRIFKRRMETLHGLLGDSLAPGDDADWELSPEKREELLGALDLKPAAGEVAVMEPVRSVGARERRIRRSGRRVLWGAAACFAITLVVAALFSVQERKMKGGGRAANRALAEKLQKRERVGREGGKAGGADQLNWQEVQPPSAPNDTLGSVEEAPAAEEPGGRAANQIAGRELARRGVRTDPGAESDAFASGLERKQERRERETVGDVPDGLSTAAVQEPEGEFNQPGETSMDKPKLSVPLDPGKPAGPGTDDSGLAGQALDAVVPEDGEVLAGRTATRHLEVDPERFAKRNKDVADGRSEFTTQAAEPAEAAPGPGPAQQQGQAGDGSAPDRDHRGGGVPLLGDLPAISEKLFEGGQAPGTEGRGAGEGLERGRANPESLVWGSMAGGGAGPQSGPASPPVPGEPVAGKEAAIVDHLQRGNEGGRAEASPRRTQTATLSIVPPQASGGVERPEEPTAEHRRFGALREETRYREAQDQTQAGIAAVEDSDGRTTWSMQLDDQRGAAADSKKGAQPDDSKPVAQDADARSIDRNPAMDADEDLGDDLFDPYAGSSTGQATNRDFTDAEARLHFFNSDGVRPNVRQGGLEGEPSIYYNSLSNNENGTAGAGFGGGLAPQEDGQSALSLDGVEPSYDYGISSGTGVERGDATIQMQLGRKFAVEGQNPGYLSGFVQGGENGAGPSPRFSLLRGWSNEVKDSQELESLNLAEKFQRELEEVEAEVEPSAAESSKSGVAARRVEDLGQTAKVPGKEGEASSVYDARNQAPTGFLESSTEDKRLAEKKSVEFDRSEFEVRTWDVPVAAWAKLQRGEALEGAGLDARQLLEESDALQLGIDPKEALAEYGVAFPEGTTASYEVATGKMIVTNTAENLGRIDGVVQESLQRLEREREAKERFETSAAEKPTSTFSLHVSDVSFKLAKAALDRGEWPTAEQIRVEEFVNAFDYGDPAPTQEEKVACALGQAAHPFLQQRNLLRVSMRTAALGRAAGTPLRLTVLLDKSGSMERLDRAESVRMAFELLAAELAPQDQVTLLSFARTTRLLADRVAGDKAGRLAELVATTPSEGGTNLEEALRIGIEKAGEQFLEGGQNRIILLTDGAANLGNAKPDELAKVVEEMRQQGIAFDACGVGADGLNDKILESLTRKGDGRYYFLDRPEDADDGFAQQIAGALRPAARNVKVQVTFNPERVGHYRLYGFEKHLLKKEDFRNDSVDAAELAAEEAGNAIYHVQVRPEGRGAIGTVAVRFQDMASGRMVEKEWTIPYDPDATRLDEAAPSMRLAAGAALLGERLKGSAVGEVVELDRLGPILSALPSDFPSDGRVKELAVMAAKVRELTGE